MSFKDKHAKADIFQAHQIPVRRKSLEQALKNHFDRGPVIVETTLLSAAALLENGKEPKALQWIGVTGMMPKEPHSKCDLYYIKSKST